MNGQDPNQNLNNINPEGAQAPTTTPGQVPVDNLASPAPAAPEMTVATPAPAAPVAIDPASVMPAAPAAPAAPEMTVAVPTPEAPAPAPAPAAPVMPDPASVMPAAPAAPMPAAETPDMTVASPAPTPEVPAPAPAAIDPSSVMPAAPAAPVAPVVPEAPTVVPGAPATPVAPVPGQAPVVDPNAGGQVPPVAPAAAPNATAEEKPAKKGIAIDKNIIIIVVGLIIIVAVLLFAWKSGILFNSKIPAAVPNPNPAVNNVTNNTTPTPAPENKIKNPKEAKKKIEAMPWFDELIKTRYSELESSEDILEDTDVMLFVAYELSKESSSSKTEDISSSSCDIDAKAMQISEINKVLNTVFDDELANKNLTSSTYKIYAAEEYAKLKSSSTCSQAKLCSDTETCKITDSYVLFDNEENEYENTLKYEDLSYDEDTQELSGKLVMTYTSNTKEATFVISFDDDELIKSIEIEK